MRLHGSSTVKVHFKGEIYVLEWSGNNPNLNSVENALHIVKNNVVEKKSSRIMAFVEAMNHVRSTDVTED